MPASAFKTVFLLLTLLASCTQWVFNEKKVSRYINRFGLRTKGSSESDILIFGWVLTCAGSGMNKETDELGPDINNESTLKKRVVSFS